MADEEKAQAVSEAETTSETVGEAAAEVAAPDTAAKRDGVKWQALARRLR